MTKVTRRLQAEVLDRLHLAFQAFFRRVRAGAAPGYPRFKGREHYKTISSRYVEPAWYKFNGGEVKLKVKGLPVLDRAGGKSGDSPKANPWRCGLPGKGDPFG